MREAIVNGKKKRGYATQKPLSLLSRIIKSSTDPGDIVLDAFAGSCTTAKAAEDLGRGWIVIDKSAEACNIVKKRLSDLIAGNIKCTREAPKRTDVGDDPSESRAVYIITDSTAPDLVKVGISADPTRRLESLRTGRPHREQLQLAFQHYTPRYRELEKHLHQQFPRNHEWVKASVEEVKRALAEFLK